jgi:hypothetical protein
MGARIDCSHKDCKRTMYGEDKRLMSQDAIGTGWKKVNSTWICPKCRRSV